MTEEEAKTKWCPMVRVNYANLTDVGVARAEQTSRCIGSACMMWREDITMVAFPGASMAYVKTEGGHCGLAGQR